MKKFLGIALKVIGALILIGGLGIFALGYYFNPDRMKPMAVSYMKDHYNRTISIGDVSWKIFPRLGISIDNITLGNAPGFGEGNFATFKNASIFVKTLELFSGKIHVERMELNSPAVDFKVNKQGEKNWSDLTQSSNASSSEKSSDQTDAHSEKSAGGISHIEFNVESIEISDGAFSYQDEKTGEKYDIKNLHLSGQNVGVDKDFPVDLKLHVVSNAPQLDTDISAKGNMRIAKTTSYDLNDVSLNGDIAISNLLANGLKLSNLKTPLKLEKSVLEMSNVSANLYEGTVNGSITVNAQSEPMDVQANYDIKGSDITSMLHDLGQKQTFSGKLNMKGNVRFKAHPEKNDLTRSMNGTASMKIHNGAINGVDLAYWYGTGMNIMQAKNTTQLALGAVGAMAGAAGNNTGKTPFIDAWANFNLNAGVLSNKDLNVYTERVYGQGAGTINLISQTIDYNFNISGVAKNGNEYKPTGQVIPLKITGSIDNPKMNVDISPVVGGVLQNVVPSAVTGNNKNSGGGAGTILQGIFGN